MLARMLLPSEIARLVYGQLKSMNCHTVAEKLLNTSPHLEECREHVEKTKTPDFLTEAFCLSLEKILNQYLTMRCSILDEVNGLIPDSDRQYSDPVAALKFLLTLNEVPSDVDIDSRTATESSPKFNNEDDETGSNINQYLESSEKTAEPCDYNADLNLSSDSDSIATGCGSYTVPKVTHSPVQHGNDLFPKLKRKNRFLDDLYASTESLDTSKKKKTVKVLRPRQTALERPLTLHTERTHSIGEDSAIESEKNTTLDGSCNSEISLSEDRSDDSVFLSRRTPAESSKSTSTRQLRSYTKSKEEIVPVESSTKTLKQLKSRKKKSLPSNADTALEKDVKSGKILNSVEEGDTGVDVTRISQMFIENPKWPELIAENINKTFSETPKKKIESGTEDTDSVFKSIAEKTLSADPDICEEFIRGLLTCTQNLTSEKSEETGTNFGTVHGTDENVPIQCAQQTGFAESNNECAGQSTETNSALENERLQENMNEFIRFGNQSNNVNSNETDVIFVGIQAESNMGPNDNEYIIQSYSQMVNKNYVACTSDELPLQSESKIPEQDEIINLCDDGQRETHWGLHSNPVLAPVTCSTASTIAGSNAKRKLQLYGSVVPLSRNSKESSKFRPIAPKPVPSEPISGIRSDANVPEKPPAGKKTGKRQKK